MKTADVSMEILFKQAIDEIENLAKGEKFLVKDLFKGYEWNRLSLKDRSNLGRLFFMPSQNRYLEDGTIKALKKNSANQQIYEKVK